MEPDRKKRSTTSSDFKKKEEEPKKVLEECLMLPKDRSALSETELHKKLEQAKEMNRQVQYHIDLLFEKLGVKSGERKEFMAKIAAKSPELYNMILEERKKWSELTNTVSSSKETEKNPKLSNPERGRKSLKLSARNRNWISMR